MNPRFELLLTPRWIILSFVLAFALTLSPFFGQATLWMPRWPYLVLLFWVIYQPRRVGFLTAMSVGLLMDMLGDYYLGLNALVYLSSVMLCFIWYTRIQKASSFEQMLWVIFIYTLAQLSTMAILLVLGQAFMPAGMRLWSILLVLVIWLPMVWCLLWPTRRTDFYKLQ